MKLKIHRDFFKECAEAGDVKHDDPFVTRCPHSYKGEGICTAKTCPKKMDYLTDLCLKPTEGNK